MKTYVLEKKGEIHAPKLEVNKRGFYKEELEQIIKNVDIKNYNIICIEDEIEKYNLCDNACKLNEKVYAYQLWNAAYMNNNLNGFSLPLSVDDNNEYRIKLKDTLNKYMKYLNCPAFAYEKKNIACIRNECELILKVLDNSINGEIKVTEKIMNEILNLFIEDSFLVNELDKSYSFRGIAPFPELRHKGYDEDYKNMMDNELTFFRTRVSNEYEDTNISEVEHMLHLPYCLRDKASCGRFNISGCPSLYLGTTSYICSKECKWNGSDNLYASVFVPNGKGKKFKILNLTISQALINGIGNVDRKLQNSMLKIFPLVIATSFSIKNEERIKYQYLISQILMNVANENGIDGIAYLSMKGKDELQFPQGVNLVIFAHDISNENQYSEKCSGFIVSKPVLYQAQEGKHRKSYINEAYSKNYSNGGESFAAKLEIDGKNEYYCDTCYGKFDNYLVSTLK